MVKRRKTKKVRVGQVIIGSSAPVVIQSMTKVPTVDIGRCVRQINQLVKAGCRLVRIAVPTRPMRAIEAIEAGAAKVRLNPGNIKKRESILRIIDAAKMHKTAIRVGVN
ncbi:MAG: flavodoxin-dependent (E)-4-hydroxy-3-methylbut-2-enyl-diphosphate synthase, partial [Planctomycetota bacterium]